MIKLTPVQRANNRAKRQIFALMEEYITENQDGTVQYLDDWTDLGVSMRAHSLNPDSDLTLAVVTSIRSRYWGPFRKTKRVSQAQRIAELENTVRELLDARTAPKEPTDT